MSDLMRLMGSDEEEVCFFMEEGGGGLVLASLEREGSEGLGIFLRAAAIRAEVRRGLGF